MSIVGFAASWLKAVFFADNLALNGFFLFLAKWVVRSDLSPRRAPRAWRRARDADLRLVAAVRGGDGGGRRDRAVVVETADGSANRVSFHPNDIVRRGRAASIIVCGVLVFLLSAFFRAQVMRNQEYSLQVGGESTSADSDARAARHDLRPQQQADRRERRRLLGRAAGAERRHAARDAHAVCAARSISRPSSSRTRSSGIAATARARR